MVVVEMSDDIRKYETKEFGPFTKRELKYVLTGLATGAVFALIIPVSLVARITIGFVIFFMFLLCGYVQMGGIYFEVLILKIAYLYFLTPARRKNKTENFYRKALNEMKKQEEADFYKSLTAKEQRAYKKSKEKKKITYSSNPEFKVYR